MLKIMDFTEFSPFNKLRLDMGAELIKEFNFDLGISLLDADFIKQLGKDGIEIDNLDEINFKNDNTLEYKGQRILIYIRDINQYSEEIRLPKFHLSSCSTLKNMWKKKRSERYVLYQRDDGVFKIHILQDGKQIISHEKLNICRNCLTILNWNNYIDKKKSLKTEIVQTFSIAEFFEKYPKSLLSVKPKYTADTAPLNEYHNNWDAISEKRKFIKNYCCENIDCKVSLTGKYGKYLHVHHMDAQKNNNSESNLKVLCIKCHAEQSLHGHMKRLLSYKKFISIYEALQGH